MIITAKKLSLERVINELALTYGYLSIDDVLQYVKSSFADRFSNVTANEVLVAFKKLVQQYKMAEVYSYLIDDTYYFNWTTSIIWIQKNKYSKMHRVDKDEWIKSAINNMQTKKIRTFSKKNYTPDAYSNDSYLWYDTFCKVLDKYILIDDAKERMEYITKNVFLNVIFVAGEQMDSEGLYMSVLSLGAFDRKKTNNMKVMNELSKHIMNLFNNTRRWRLRGYSPIEYDKKFDKNTPPDKENAGITVSSHSLGGDPKQNKHETDLLHLLMWSSWNHGVITLTDLLNNCKKLNIDTNVAEITSVVNLKGNRDSMRIHENCLCALLKFTDENVPNVGFVTREEKFLGWFDMLTAKQRSCPFKNELDNLENFINGHVYPEIVSEDWNKIAKILGVDPADRHFGNILDFYKHSDINKSEFKKFILKCNVADFLHVSDEEKLNALIEEICYYIPTWANKGLSLYKINKLKQS